jgi:transcriptional regulator with XRE-family HTH domain
MISKLWEKLRDPEYRKAFVASQINIGIPFQIRALMKSGVRNWRQEELARRTGMLQPRISAMLRPGKTKPNIETLRRIADAFDCGLMVRFVPFSELVRWSERFDPDAFAVPDFATEDVASLAALPDSRLATLPVPVMQKDALDSTATNAVEPDQTMAGFVLNIRKQPGRAALLNPSGTLFDPPDVTASAERYVNA